MSWEASVFTKEDAEMMIKTAKKKIDGELSESEWLEFRKWVEQMSTRMELKNKPEPWWLEK